MRIRIQIHIRGGGGVRSAKNVHPPWQNPRYVLGGAVCAAMAADTNTIKLAYGT
jgi:hypothetical protein